MEEQKRKRGKERRAERDEKIQENKKVLREERKEIKVTLSASVT